MPGATIVVRSDGVNAMQFSGEIEMTETETGWRVRMAIREASRETEPWQLMEVTAEVILGQMQYRGRVVEYQPAEGRVVVEGEGPLPA